jgi:uncharacterized membrane protein
MHVTEQTTAVDDDERVAPPGDTDDTKRVSKRPIDRVASRLRRERRSRGEAADLGNRIADRVTAFSGSWGFLGLHIVWWVLWIFVLHVEPFPYGLLTMVLSLEAIVLTTLVLMSQNRAAARDRLALEKEQDEVAEVDRLEVEQMEILREMRTHIADHATELRLLCALLAKEPPHDDARQVAPPEGLPQE